ncbi:hypothetical protein DPEC_G00024270 [Dallia pectoralis]|uniref:Uncharacterized protein n=1 Tax=Dallia pectoralis TaxID=75939 RepID=A0ACC2HH09_DALPE|nr:hypothetical protein DPEC_G00024270 [Dallia pectoralis]
MDQYISFCLSLLSLVFGIGSAVTIHGHVGDTVTLTCKYDARSYGVLSVCWGRGHIPNSGCANEILRTEGLAVTLRSSPRYQLRGNLRSGDVSLSIAHAQLKDSGTYGCRVDVPGWFNDQKHHVALVIQPAPQTTPKPQTTKDISSTDSPLVKHDTTAIHTTTVLSAPPEPPTVEVGTPSARTLSIYWTAGFDGNSPINSYHVEYKRQTDSWDLAVRGRIVIPEGREVAINNLKPFSTYNIRMFAKNNVGLSTASNVLTITTEEAVPDGPPQDVNVEAISAHSILVQWRAPEPSVQNGQIRGYHIHYSEYSPPEQSPLRVVRVMDGGESFTVNNLQGETNYTVSVVTINSAGMGPFSEMLICTTLSNDDLQQMTTSQATTEIQTEHSISTTFETTTLADSWVVLTDSPTQDHKVDFSTFHPPSDRAVDNQASDAEKQSGHLVAILVPALVLGLLVVMAILYQIRRATLKKGSMNIHWKSNDFLHFGNSEAAL